MVFFLTLTLFAGLTWTNGGTQVVIFENHYLVYEIPEVFTFSGQIQLFDQFGDFQTTSVVFDKFANPVQKNDEPMWDPLLHQTWWQIDDPVEPCNERLVALDNQFGRQDWYVSHGRYLVLPAFKNLKPPIPTTPLNHYKCYEALGPALNITVVLVDQFGTYNVTVTDPAYFCNPCEKQVDGMVYPIVDSQPHFACYLLQGDWIPITLQALLLDQFGERWVTIEEPCWLCVPSEKLEVTPTEQNTWGQVKALYN
jgi:hypothetical protein